MSRPVAWREVYWGGSAEAEECMLRTIAEDIFGIWQAHLDETVAARGMRMMYAKTVLVIDDALLLLDRLLPAELAVGHFHPGVSLPASLRLSNASNVPQPDTAPDMRGLAVRLTLSDGDRHDLLFTNSPAAIVRDAKQFLAYFMASHRDPDRLLANLANRLGERESRGIAARLKTSFRLCASLACERFWSCGALLWGEVPVRLKLIPLSPPPPADIPKGQDGLRADIARRLTAGDIRFRLAVQRYVNEEDTPIEDAAAEWNEQITPPAEIGTLVLPQRDFSSPQLSQAAELELDPWNAPPQFRPLGSLNRLRRFLYPLAAKTRREADKA